MPAYREEMVARFWEYQRTFFSNWEAFFERPEMPGGRPPVFLRKHASYNILMDPHVSKNLRKQLVDEIPPRERHKWFRSMSSSQAIAQSVFGNLKVYDRLSCLNELTDEDGSRIFGEPVSTVNFTMEHKVDSLGEPRPTSLDGFIPGDYCVAIECKLTEPEVGSCSRPLLRKKASNYNADFCDGTYTRQRGRKSRCTLTEIGVRYWDFVPEIFRWNGDVDLTPCPLRKNYQLVRNLLSVAVRDGVASLGKGHVVLVYDERNPAFQREGRGYRAFEETRDALRDPLMLKKCSWQNLVALLRDRNELPWLPEQLGLKYGI